MNENYAIKQLYELEEIHEICVDWNGWRYFVIFGKHVNGWFVAIPNQIVCMEVGHPEEVIYNSEKLAEAMKSANAGCVIANSIYKCWKEKADD